MSLQWGTERQPLDLEANIVVPDLPLNLPCEITGKSPTSPGLFPQLSGLNNDWLCVLSQMLLVPYPESLHQGVHLFPAAVLAKGSWIGFPESLFQVLLLESPTWDTSLKVLALWKLKYQRVFNMILDRAVKIPAVTFWLKACDEGR